jgi:hypothetical protein
MITPFRYRNEFKQLVREPRKIYMYTRTVTQGPKQPMLKGYPTADPANKILNLNISANSRPFTKILQNMNQRPILG